jgi:hypothetical protein
MTVGRDVATVIAGEAKPSIGGAQLYEYVGSSLRSAK